VAISFAFYALHHHFVVGKPAEVFGGRYIAWLGRGLAEFWVLSALSDIGGGFDMLGFRPGAGAVAVAIWSLVVIALALASALPATETAEIMVRVEVV
jgi:hypothetical protein